MDMLDWLERQGYVSNYPGEWIVLSWQATEGEAEQSTHKLEFHGKQREDAMDTIQLMWKSTPELWTVAIKVPGKPRSPQNNLNRGLSGT
jgi:hypothetical protein